MKPMCLSSLLSPNEGHLNGSRRAPTRPCSSSVKNQGRSRWLSASSTTAA
ncbi:Mariner Mos1 transposase [Caligus rogercresseyi]|uniref:Mariner Mos1 transposase n=1 Tax=Caligus rogercresseyi TaxID=217165 RepID=A0A7T8HIL0_CALRO|nr:Mariner Mos1 transposase [Caligus rogercresseyi]